VVLPGLLSSLFYYRAVPISLNPHFYYLTNTCNKWTAKALKSIGMDIKPIFYLSAESIMDYLNKHPATLKDSS